MVNRTGAVFRQRVTIGRWAVQFHFEIFQRSGHTFAYFLLHLDARDGNGSSEVVELDSRSYIVLRRGRQWGVILQQRGHGEVAVRQFPRECALNFE